MDTTNNCARFQLGRLTATPSVLELVPRSELLAAVKRHQCGDWGKLSENDRQANHDALRNGGRILSAYRSNKDVPFWIVTEEDRSHTTVLLPSEY